MLRRLAALIAPLLVTGWAAVRESQAQTWPAAAPGETPAGRAVDPSPALGARALAPRPATMSRAVDRFVTAAEAGRARSGSYYAERE